MAKYDAVDRLMTLATEKRADRVAEKAALAPHPTEESDGSASGSSSAVPLALSNANPGSGASARQGGPGAAARGRQLLDTIRPLLPAVAGAMRLVDHGAVQAVARLLPLLGSGFTAGAPSQAATLSAEQEKWHQSVVLLQSSQQATRKDLEALTHQLAAAEDLLGRTRTHLERMAAEQKTREDDLRMMGDRVRLLSAGLIILLLLIVAEMILMVVMLHR